MTSTLPTPSPADASAARAHPLFRRTVDRQLVHRAALSEVFLTDCVPTGPAAYVAAAQIPTSHTYYGDSLGAHGLADPLLLMECARQAETCGGHLVFGLGHDSRFVLRDWALELVAPGMPVRPGEPAELVIEIEGQDVRRAGDLVHGLVFRMRLSSGGEPVGAGHIRVGYLREEAYAHVRQRHRTGPPPWSPTLPPVVDGTPVAPHLVGRTRAGNVVLLDARTAAGEVLARIRPAVEHPSLFDHAQDHMPGMVLLEAARQAGLLALHDLFGAAPSAHVLTGFTTSFARYAELDAPVLVRALPRPAGPDPGAGHPVDVEFLQDGQVTAAGTVTFAPVRAGSPAPPTGTPMAG